MITVTNCDTGIDIKTFTASVEKILNYLNHVWPITLDGNFADWDGVDKWESTRNNSTINFYL